MEKVSRPRWEDYTFTVDGEAAYSQALEEWADAAIRELVEALDWHHQNIPCCGADNGCHTCALIAKHRGKR